MSVSPSYSAFVLDQLTRVVPGVTSRRMFGGVGIYAGGWFFAIIDDDTVYFKVDDANRGDFERRGMGPFRPHGPEGEAMQYFELPGEVLEDAELLRPWAEAAVAVARRQKTKKRS